ncbi:MAG: ribosomal protein [Candidatus Parcubacteria bacterium]|jgi:ribosomal protein S6
MLDTENDVRIYELGYWFVPTIAESAIEDQVTELKNKLTSKGAVVISEETAYLREIAYEMCKVIQNQNHYFDEGYFGWIKFEMDPAHTETLRKELELDPNIIRSLITQTVRENTVYTKRPASIKKDDDDDDSIEETELDTPDVASVETVADDITIIEGLGPKAAEALILAGIDTFAKLAAASKEEIEAILEASASKVQHLDPSTWSAQAALAADGKMDELKALQAELNNGREV